MRKYHFIFALILGVGLFACKKNIDSGKNSLLLYQYDFFPVEVGYWVEYQVDSITYDDFYDPVKIDTASYYIREEVADSFIDDAGYRAQTINVYRREGGVDSIWRLIQRDVVNLLPNRAERVEDNLRFIKMVFPSFNNQTWSGNSYLNTDDEDYEFYEGWIYSYKDLYGVGRVGDQTFDSVMTVVQRDYENLLEKNYFEERYVKRIGLVYKKKHAVGKQNIGEDWTHGYELTYTMIDHKD